MTETTITLIAIAAVLAIARMLLQRQKDMDRLHGVAQEDSAYTVWGIIKMMRQERKDRKYKAREAQRKARERNAKQTILVKPKEKDPT